MRDEYNVMIKDIKYYKQAYKREIRARRNAAEALAMRERDIDNLLARNAALAEELNLLRTRLGETDEGYDVYGC